MPSIFLILFLVLLSAEISAQAPTIDQQWFHKNSTLPLFDTGLSRLSFPPSVNPEILISVVGSGVDVNHPYLKESISQKEERNFSLNSGDVTDESGSGTHVAGVIASFSKNSPATVFKKIKILALKVEDAKGPSISQQVIAAMNYSQSMGSKIIILALNWRESQVTPELLNALDRVQKAGIVLISGAGDFAQGQVNFPCAHKGIICVGSSDRDGSLSSFSNFGLSVDFVAPGSQILSSIPISMRGKLLSMKGYDLKDSSFSSAGIIAVYVATILAYNPRLSRDDIYLRLALAASDRPSKTSVNGFPSLDKILVPGFKDLHLVASKERAWTPVVSNSSSIQFEVLNPGNAAGRVNLQYVAGSSDFTLGKLSETVVFASKQSSQIITLPISLKSMMADKRIQIEIKITSAGITKSWFHTVNLVVDNAGEAIGEIQGTGNIIRTVKGGKDSYLYSFDRNRNLSLYRLGSKAEYLGYTPVPAGEQPLFDEFKISDFDGDGIEDLFWMTEKSSVERGIYYSTSAGMKSKYAGSWIIDQKINKGVDIHFMDFSFEGKKLKVPVFITTGSVTKSDVLPGDFSVIDPDRHLYWLEPRRDSGKIIFVTRTLSNEKFRNKVLSNLTVEVNSLLDFMTIFKKSDSIVALAGVKDSEGIVQSGVSIEIASLDGSSKVHSIGFDRPLDQNGLLLPILSLDNSLKADTLFISAPAVNRISLFDIFNVPTGGHRMASMGDLTVPAGDIFVDVPHVQKDAAGAEAAVQSLYSLQFLSVSKIRSVFPLMPMDKVQKLKAKTVAFVIDHTSSSGKGLSILLKTNDKMTSPVKFSLRPKSCAYAGEGNGNLFFSCESQGLTRIQMFKAGL